MPPLTTIAFLQACVKKLASSVDEIRSLQHEADTLRATLRNLQEEMASVRSKLGEKAPGANPRTRVCERAVQSG